MTDAPRLPDPLEPDALGSSVAALASLTQQLRAECPWDRAQTAGTIVPHTVEEVYEVVDAVTDVEHALASGAVPDLSELADELGDLLFQVAFLAMWCGELDPSIDIGSIARGIVRKLVRRHPHVYGDSTGTAEVATADDVRSTWEGVKRDTEQRGLFDGVPRSLPALARARKLQQRAAGIGFDFSGVRDALAKVDEELAELRAAIDAAEQHGGAVTASEGSPAADHVVHEVGDLLFAVSNAARLARVDPELALDACSTRFRTRVETAIRLAGDAGAGFATLDQADQETWYVRAKQELARRAD